jgi:hypothetical protein
MTLQDLIGTLAAMPTGAAVRLDSGRTPTRLCSWRGAYSQLSLGSEPDGAKAVSDLLNDARSAIGREFTGYHGGEYAMSGDTPMWADEWGFCDYNALTGVAIKDGVVELQTVDVSEYR